MRTIIRYILMYNNYIFPGRCHTIISNLAIKVAVQACDHEIIKACLIQTRSTDCNKLYIK